jgi:hypothetical protein
MSRLTESAIPDHYFELTGVDFEVEDQEPALA